MLRKPVVAGSFYPSSSVKLSSMINSFLNLSREKEDALGIVAPHAGYIYSGKTAGAIYSKVNITDTVIILSPNHTGVGAQVSMMAEGEWETPLGEVKINSSLATSIISYSSYITNDYRAHQREHSIEVQIPFLQSIRSDFTMVPITLGHIRYNVCEEVGLALAKAILQSGKRILIIASSDMNHYDSDEVTKKKDMLAIEKILNLDPAGLLKTAYDNNITMCGVIPTAVMLIACKELKAKEAVLVDYSHSGEVSGDNDAVVGYAGIMVK